MIGNVLMNTIRSPKLDGYWETVQNNLNLQKSRLGRFGDYIIPKILQTCESIYCLDCGLYASSGGIVATVSILTMVVIGYDRCNIISGGISAKRISKGKVKNLFLMSYYNMF